MGAAAPHDLEAGLRLLQEAAERGNRSALAELAALAGNWDLVEDLAAGRPPGGETAGEVRAAVDFAAWRTFPGGDVLSAEPRIAVSPRFLSPRICDWLIRLGKPHLRRAELIDGVTGQVREDADRTNRSAELTPEHGDMVLAFVRARIAAMANVAVPALDFSQILHYEVGQQFRQHYDFFDVSVPAYAREVATSGQRALTVLVYLNDDYEGGHTAFPRLNRAFRGNKGDALIFWNLQPDGKPDFRTLHVGTAPTRGEKWLFSQWIRVRAA